MSAPRPIALRIDRESDILNVRVVAAEDGAADARFELELASEGGGGTTKTVQSGTSRGASAGTTLLTSRIRTGGLHRWNARLHVVAGKQEYVVIESD